MLLDATCWNHTIYFLLGVNIYCVFTLKKPFANFFFQNLLSGRKRHLIRVWIYRTLFGICHILSNCSPYHFSIFFKFTIPKEHFCDGCSFSFSFLLLKMSLKCSINVQSASKDKTLICTIWWYKVDTDKYIKNGFYTKIFSLIWNEFIWVKLQAFHILLFWRRNSFAGFCFCFWPPV